MLVGIIFGASCFADTDSGNIQAQGSIKTADSSGGGDIGALSKIKRNLCWELFRLLPKKRNRVMLQSYYGRGFSDSPKAIALEMLKTGGFELYWCVKRGEEGTLPAGITPVYIDTIRAIFHFCRAGIWVDNCRKWRYVRKTSRQFYIQTWHGFPLKRIEKDAGNALDSGYIKSARYDGEITDLMLSNSEFLTKIYKSSFWYSGEVLQKGFPRNDALVVGGGGVNVHQALGIDTKKRLLLYAPTFRADFSLEVYDVDYAGCVRALGERFGGDWIVLAKLHPNLSAKANQLSLDPEYVKNASSYPDIQELYVTCDAILTDYSSVMFDFMVTKKPCFLYVNDKSAYESDRNFYFDLDKLPFAAAQSNKELQKRILEFDKGAQDRAIEEFTREFGIMETGEAAKYAVQVCKNRL